MNNEKSPVSLVESGLDNVSGVNDGVRVLIPLPDRDFDTTEVSIPWQHFRANGVFVYRVNEVGKLLSLRAYWEFANPDGAKHEPVVREV